jgi:hypothetical protein
MQPLWAMKSEIEPVHPDANQNWPYREHLDLKVFLQAVAFSWHICEAVHSGHGDLDDIFKIFAFGAIAGSQGLFGQISDE